MLTMKSYITPEKPMNFTAVYIGHRCTLWFCTFALNKYFGSRVFLQKSFVMKWFTPCSCATSAFICDYLWQNSISFHGPDPLAWYTACYWVLGFGWRWGILGPPGLVSASRCTYASELGPSWHSCFASQGSQSLPVPVLSLSRRQLHAS